MASFLERCRALALHTALDTCGMCSESALRTLTRHADLVLYDVKEIDPERHARLTGQTNEKILANFRGLLAHVGADRVVPRIPLIPGFNTSAVAFESILAFLFETGYRGAVHLMPYNRLSSSKYGKIGEGERYRDMGVLDDDVLERCVSAIEARGSGRSGFVRRLRRRSRPEKALRTCRDTFPCVRFPAAAISMRSVSQKGTASWRRSMRAHLRPQIRKRPATGTIDSDSQSGSARSATSSTRRGPSDETTQATAARQTRTTSNRSRFRRVSCPAPVRGRAA